MTITRLLPVAALLLAATAQAAGGDSWSAPAGKAEDPAVANARAALQAGDYAGAQLPLKVALAAQPDSADLHNMYAFALRKGANPDMALVFRHYREALRLDPKHRGAHEYIGEAYLMAGEPAKAREHLAALDKLCFFGCAEYDMLKKAIAGYEAKGRR
jgi:Tfp pilus assembly protein PilF